MDFDEGTVSDGVRDDGDGAERRCIGDVGHFTKTRTDTAVGSIPVCVTTRDESRVGS